MSSLRHLVPPLATLLTLVLTSRAVAQPPATATATISSGPHAGTYAIDTDVPCTIGPLDDGDPDRFEVVLATEAMKRSRNAATPNVLGMITVSIPNVAANRLGELAFDVVFGDPTIRARRGRTPGTNYSIDTRTDAALKPFQREMRGPHHVSGKGGARLTRQGGTAVLAFWGETASGIRVDGRVECHRVDRR